MTGRADRARRLEETADLRKEIGGIIRSILDDAGSKKLFELEVGYGEPNALRSKSRAKKRLLFQVRVRPLYWRAVVLDGLARLDDMLCLEAWRRPPPAGADGAWDVFLFEPVSGKTVLLKAVRLAGHTCPGATVEDAHERCVAHWRRILEGDA